MDISVIGEYGYEQALLGIGLSYGLTSKHDLRKFIADTSMFNRIEGIAINLARSGGSHAKFLESISVWLDIRATRYWWQQEATYRCGISRQSESTMHTIKVRELTRDDFDDIPQSTLDAINLYIRSGDFDLVKSVLPEGFLQRRVVCTNYKTIQHVLMQRRNHRLEEWHIFIDAILGGLQHPEFLEDVS